MPALSDPRGFRRTAAGLCLVAAPVVYVAALVVDPAIRQGGDPVGIYGRYPEQVTVSAALLHWSWVLLIPGIIGMIHLIRRRGVVLGHLAGGLALLGVVNFSALMLGDFFYSRLERAMEPARGAALGDEALADPGAVFGFQIPGFAGLLGLFLLGLVLAYARRELWWAPFAMLLGIFGAPVYPIGTVVGGLLYLAGSGAIGLRMLRMSDAEWAGEEPAQPVSAVPASGNRAATR
ncbi:hypothetical protein [Planomonospora venezuelensis]|uniref:Putative membrane protein n=1 Tax=Planomonospora venezuelensis TaxID=1999 RepID=A0A841CZ59_PLAVE|nr:hypothetical protein [Planomonospora venezuelensis]MBB5962579.1 putative membrane protein [Planomonospora venezuelensis]GIM99016.1 hypothetical protein Pve01_06750 [Planomonospora venezuelensis]